eukprot:TRINITY_DN12438_c0_g3_i1.p1 TRINITY_DN12438_c0_g3~~TRINITY_DN12438_c0_g3_i1.p1  ORF type:complete len:848 (+),score=286.88 TRINITY_DN12438_c0_g3_i1:61-2604(+)
MTQHMKGQLHVEVVEARNLKNTDTWGKISPSCSVQIGSQFQRTNKHKEGGSNPKWNKQLDSFMIDTEKDASTSEMHVRVFDKDSRMGSKFVTDLIGRVNVGSGSRSVFDFRYITQPVMRWVPLTRQSGKNRGHAGFRVWFQPEGEAEVMNEEEFAVAEETGHQETADETVATPVSSVPQLNITEVEGEMEEDADVVGLRHTHDVLRVFCDMVADSPYCSKKSMGSIARFGVIQLIVRLCEENDCDELLESCAAALLSLTFDCNENIVAVAANNGIPALIGLCNSRTHDGTLREACGTLRNLADNDDTSAAIGVASGIPALLHVCDTNKTEEVLEQAASALANLSNNAANLNELLNPEPIRIIVALCQNFEDEGIHEACTFLLHKIVEEDIALSDDNGDGCLDRDEFNDQEDRMYISLQYIAQAQGCQALVRLCQISHNSSVLWKAAKLLEDLSDLPPHEEAEENREAITDCNGIAPLICLCRVMQLEAQSAEDGEVDPLGSKALTSAANCLWILARGSVHRSEIIVQTGGASAMISLCSTALVAEVLEAAAGTLGDVANVKPAFQVALSGMGAITALCRVIRDLDKWSEEDDSLTQADVLRQVAWALSEIIMDNEDNCTHLVDQEGGIGMMISLMHSYDDAFLLEQAAAALSHIAFYDQFKNALLEAGAVAALVRVLTLEGPTPGRLRNGAGAIANLVARNSDAAEAAITTVKPLTDSLKEICRNPETRDSPDLVIVIEQLNRAVMNLAMEHNCAVKIAESEVAIPMLDLVKFSNEQVIKLSAAGALVNLSSDNDANLIVAKLTGGIPPHVRLLWANDGADYEKVVMGAADPHTVSTTEELQQHITE